MQLGHTLARVRVGAGLCPGNNLAKGNKFLLGLFQPMTKKLSGCFDAVAEIYTSIYLIPLTSH